MYALHKTLFAITLAAMSLCASAQTQTFQSASEQAKQDLDGALELLQSTRESIASI